MEKKVERSKKEGYFKLEEINNRFTYVVDELDIVLGRLSVNSNQIKSFYSLGSSKLISRIHAKIRWNQTKGYFELECVGKNGCWVNNSSVKVGEVVKLDSQSGIEIGDQKFFFLQASVLSNMLCE
eukprot:TRINITY_DN2329_c0_g1_i1.p2 TRINITY_DN2329_c0_g1~~TRINITY_DN2329_c0_g1_i1.p2  ORF type:complete len:125 (+),score=19.99 TRINITY_DN2329_c0_g1_i1:143-517(+)